MKVKTFYAALAVLAIALGSVTTAMADDITADVLTYDGKAKVVTAKGNVVIHANEGATIRAADGEYHSKTGVLSWKAAFIMPRIRKH